MACTIRIVAESAKLGQPEVKLGLLPGYGGTQRLPRLVGQSAALKLLLTGAAEALRIGLVDEVVSKEGLLERGEELARVIATSAPLAVKACLDAVRRGREVPLAEALEIEAVLFGGLFGTDDTKHGLQAFVDKRKPVWTGR
jgi:enoyl-CoA hydratase